MAWSFGTGHGTKLTLLTPELVGCTTNTGNVSAYEALQSTSQCYQGDILESLYASPKI
jgi:hypothetical protein